MPDITNYNTYRFGHFVILRDADFILVSASDTAQQLAFAVKVQISFRQQRKSIRYYKERCNVRCRYT